MLDSVAYCRLWLNLFSLSIVQEFIIIIYIPYIVFQYALNIWTRTEVESYGRDTTHTRSTLCACSVLYCAQCTIGNPVRYIEYNNIYYIDRMSFNKSEDEYINKQFYNIVFCAHRTLYSDTEGRDNVSNEILTG